MKYRHLGKEKLLSFGAYPVVGISAAREKRAEAKALLIQGQDPMQLKGQSQREELETFEAVAKRWHDNRKSALNPAHTERVWSRLERDVFPAIGNKPIQEITAPDVLAMIREIEKRGALDISRRAKQGVGQMVTIVVEYLLVQHRYQEAADTTDAILAVNPHDAFTMTKRGTAFAGLLQTEFIDKYPTPSMIPVPLRPRYRMLAQANAKAFADAEALGWEEPKS
jgi:integrase